MKLDEWNSNVKCVCNLFLLCLTAQDRSAEIIKLWIKTFFFHQTLALLHFLPLILITHSFFRSIPVDIFIWDCLWSGPSWGHSAVLTLRWGIFGVQVFWGSVQFFVWMPQDYPQAAVPHPACRAAAESGGRQLVRRQVSMSDFWHKMGCCVVAKPPPVRRTRIPNKNLCRFQMNHG